MMTFLLLDSNVADPGAPRPPRLSRCSAPVALPQPFEQRCTVPPPTGRAGGVCCAVGGGGGGAGPFEPTPAARKEGDLYSGGMTSMLELGGCQTLPFLDLPLPFLDLPLPFLAPQTRTRPAHKHTNTRHAVLSCARQDSNSVTQHSRGTSCAGPVTGRIAASSRTHTALRPALPCLPCPVCPAVSAVAVALSAVAVALSAVAVALSAVALSLSLSCRSTMVPVKLPSDKGVSCVPRNSKSGRQRIQKQLGWYLEFEFRGDAGSKPEKGSAVTWVPLLRPKLPSWLIGPAIARRPSGACCCVQPAVLPEGQVPFRSRAAWQLRPWRSLSACSVQCVCSAMYATTVRSATPFDGSLFRQTHRNPAVQDHSECGRRAGGLCLGRAALLQHHAGQLDGPNHLGL